MRQWAVPLACWIKGLEYLEFSGSDLGDPSVGNEFCKRLATEGKPSCLNARVSTISKEAPIGVEELVISRSIYDVDFYLMSDSTTDNADTLFWPVKVGKSAIVLRNYNNSYFWKRLATEGKPSCLNAGVSTISKEARIGVEELVISRSIYDVDFDLMSDSTTDNADTLFWPVKVGKSAIVLRNYNNSYFCKRLATEGKPSCLSAGVSTISKEARIGVEELVISRSIYDVDFYLMSDSTTDNADTLFWPVKVGKSVIVLRNYNNSYFCKRLAIEGKPSCLNAGVPTISKEARIGVEELVISRSIYDVDFYLMSDNTTEDADTLFWPVKVGKSAIVLRNYNNSYFCKRLATEGKPSCLNAGVSTISKEARIGVEELVISRSIYDVDFYLMSTTDNADTLFWPVKVGKSAIVLRNYNNSYFCKRLATKGKPSCLNAGVSTISKEARIGVEELVISRSIYDVDFYLTSDSTTDNADTLFWPVKVGKSVIVLRNYNNSYFCKRLAIEGKPSCLNAGVPTISKEARIGVEELVISRSIYDVDFYLMRPNWIWGDSSENTTEDADTLFWPVKVGKSAIVLRNYNNSYFCKRLATEGKPSCLNAGVSTISKEARIGVEELVISRSIYDVDFYLMSDSTTDNADTLFWPVKVGKSAIVLRNYNNSYFCKRLATEWKPSCLNAGVSTIIKEVRIGVEELVISRSIYDVDFYLMRSLRKHPD
ncbi:unnamed protein product [Linum tenue]|uniref:Agglutinin domain-containing protein n=1 Tax=Linum tenue TaxID=586396 RepID=A0AAV0LMS6_9ROSI|nr:unnamed protein product [Linum tenue]